MNTSPIEHTYIQHQTLIYEVYVSLARSMKSLPFSPGDIGVLNVDKYFEKVDTNVPGLNLIKVKSAS